MDVSSWSTLLKALTAGSRKPACYCGEALGLRDSRLTGGTARWVLLEHVSIPALKTRREKVRQ